MPRNFPCKKQGLALAVMLASAGTSFQTPAQDQGGEEIVVTGSFIRGPPEDAPSPVTVIARASIQEQGASQIWDLIRSLQSCVSQAKTISNRCLFIGLTRIKTGRGGGGSPTPHNWKLLKT